MDLENLKQARQTVTGTKQTQKAVECGKARHVFIARDADERVTRPIAQACGQKDIPVTVVETMDELGKACNIKVSAATAAILLED
ncbi:L7Ae/L30e/S12e/Gadd45 family ribosomal protein [Dethiobacter alkaliphilus]|uniref:Ribosomal protein L7Ae/L30e/S12e/Gadd45 n=1 Tax=Dethiobacter alkaliphilus AHT 1 TaxID=555088 RepID=C0GGC0_DETAL|nr:ribosomal L7Ae/L30e/S12e/Gadd45 family protein [Dethiobacter alkaliphilus]EEG77809.1 ribosomal protein L7Ae/L30e/S12e/Gadd45 [Dethiobacter alkaliphilus AHT 1]